jgi:hypothetical protein
MMAATPSLVFRPKFCKAEGCGACFFICSRCDHGQTYCSEECRHRSRREQLRKANRHHQQSPEGRDDHRDRQQAYRRRKAAISHGLCPEAASRPQQLPGEGISLPTYTKKTVTDQSIGSITTSAMLNQQRSKWPVEPGGTPLFDWQMIVCRFCGRTGLFINPYDVPG